MTQTLTTEWVTCSHDDPHRCQATVKTGQCLYKARPGQKLCPRHSGLADSFAKKKAAKMYELGVYQQRMEEFADSSELKSLQAEIGILRMTLEKIIFSCHGDDKMLIAYSGKISDIVIKLRALMQTCQRLDIQMGQLLSRDKVIQIGQTVVNVISEYITDPAHLEEISEKLITAIYTSND